MTHTVTFTEKEYQDYLAIKVAVSKAQWVALEESGESDWPNGYKWSTIRLLKRPELVKALTSEIDSLLVKLSKKENELFDLKQQINARRPFRQKLKELFL